MYAASSMTILGRGQVCYSCLCTKEALCLCGTPDGTVLDLEDARLPRAKLS